MLKKLNQKKSKFLIGVASLLILAFLLTYILGPYLNITLPFFSSAANNTPRFYGENIDMSQILPSSQHYVVNSKGEDLIDIAANLGINLVRITNIQRSFNNNADSVYTGKQWNQVLDKMQSKGIKALILIETDSNNSDYYAPDIRPIYLQLVNTYIDSGVFSNPDVYGVDIKNEPILTDANIKMLQTAHNMIKAKYPDLKQTVGWWGTSNSPSDPYNSNNYNWTDYSAGQKLDNIVDFYSIHMYGLANSHLGIHLSPDLETKVFVSLVEHGLQTKKPILIEEFGEANGDAVSDQGTIGSPQLQANIYQGVYQALKEMHSSQIIGSVAFDFYSRNHYPDAWAIVKNNGNYLYPAAYILQEFAQGRNNPIFPVATVVTSQSYLVTNASNLAIENLHISDRLGLKLQLNNNESYTIFLSERGVLQTVESFHYEPDSDSYYAVFQAASKGNLQFHININDNCAIGAVCPTPMTVYALTINVQ